MKPKFFLAIILFSIISCSSKKHNDLFADEIRGNASKLTMVFYSINEDSTKIIPQEKFIFTFNTDGNIIQQIDSINRNGLYVISEQTVFIYNSDGQKICARHFFLSKPFLTYSYNTNGEMSEIKSFNDTTGLLLYKTSIIRFNSDSEEFKEYLPNRKLIGTTKYVSQGDFVTDVLRYDGNGNLIGHNHFNYSNGLLQSRNDYQDETKKISFKHSNFDKYGNYLTTIGYSNGKPFRLEKRTIEYY